MNGADTLAMSLAEYQGALHHWSKMHSTEEDDPPSEAEVMAMFERMAATGMTTAH